MTLFDSIRYPISDIPTVEELAAVPRDVYEEWHLFIERWAGTDFAFRVQTLKQANDGDRAAAIRCLRRLIYNRQDKP